MKFPHQGSVAAAETKEKRMLCFLATKRSGGSSYKLDNYLSNQISHILARRNTPPVTDPIHHHRILGFWSCRNRIFEMARYFSSHDGDGRGPLRPPPPPLEPQEAEWNWYESPKNNDHKKSITSDPFLSPVNDEWLSMASSQAGGERRRQGYSENVCTTKDLIDSVAAKHDITKIKMKQIVQTMTKHIQDVSLNLNYRAR